MEDNREYSKGIWIPNEIWEREDLSWLEKLLFGQIDKMTAKGKDESCFASNKWFSEKFKEHTGVNFNEYLKRLRIDEAKKLLEKGTYKVYEVAERCGFSDVKYFMKIFREETGMSPTEWSKKHES